MKGPPSAPNSPIICLSMTDKDVVERAAVLMGTKPPLYNPRGAEKNWKPTYSCRLRGKPAVDLMTMLRPLMGERRKSQIDRALECFVDYRRHAVSRKQAYEIRRWALAGESAKSLAKEFGTTDWTVYDIKNGRTWKAA